MFCFDQMVLLAKRGLLCCQYLMRTRNFAYSETKLEAEKFGL
jgi:hypothetical protein